MWSGDGSQRGSEVVTKEEYDTSANYMVGVKGTVRFCLGVGLLDSTAEQVRDMVTVILGKNGRANFSLGEVSLSDDGPGERHQTD